MTSHIECDDLLALAACSVEEQFNAELRNQLSVSLLRHIAQANASAQFNARVNSASAFAPSSTPTAYAPATTPTTSASAYFAETMASNGLPSKQRRNPSRARTGDMMIMEDEYMQTESNCYNYEDGNDNIGDESRHFGAHAGVNSAFGFQSSAQPSNQNMPSPFATSDPFFQAVSELQAAANSKRRLEAKPFAVNAPLRVTPNPIQFGTMNAGGFNRDQFYPQIPVQGNNHVQVDAAFLQYR